MHHSAKSFLANLHPRFPIRLVIALTLVGCTNQKATASSDAGSTAEVAVATPPAASSTPEPSAKPPYMDIPSRFEYELGHRPVGAVRAEQVFAAFTAQGIVTGEAKQHLAAPFGAEYCKGSEAPKNNLFFSVCEYASDAAAQKGIENANAFGTDHRKVIRNGQSLLIIRFPAPATPAKAEKIFNAQKAMPAPP